MDEEQMITNRRLLKDLIQQIPTYDWQVQTKKGQEGGHIKGR